MELTSILGLIGIGSLLTTVVSGILSHIRDERARRKKTKLEAYESFIEAYGKAIIQDGMPVEFAAAYAKLVIVASHEVILAITEVLRTEAGTSEKLKALNGLYTAMRKDIAVDNLKVEWDANLNTPGQFR